METGRERERATGMLKKVRDKFFQVKDLAEERERKHPKLFTESLLGLQTFLERSWKQTGSNGE